MSFQPTSIVAALAGLPQTIEVAGRSFDLAIFSDYSPTDIRVCYALNDTYCRVPVDQRGSWLNPFAGGAQQSFLYLDEGISSDSELLKALVEVRKWLIEHKLIDVDFGI